jgi:hypothetical protein
MAYQSKFCHPYIILTLTFEDLVTDLSRAGRNPKYGGQNMLKQKLLLALFPTSDIMRLY